VNQIAFDSIYFLTEGLVVYSNLSLLLLILCLRSLKTAVNSLLERVLVSLRLVLTYSVCV
jgi:hypothetical protein